MRIARFIFDVPEGNADLLAYFVDSMKEAAEHGVTVTREDIPDALLTKGGMFGNLAGKATTGKAATGTLVPAIAAPGVVKGPDGVVLVVGATANGVPKVNFGSLTFWATDRAREARDITLGDANIAARDFRSGVDVAVNGDTRVRIYIPLATADKWLALDDAAKVAHVRLVMKAMMGRGVVPRGVAKAKVESLRALLA